METEAGVLVLLWIPVYGHLTFRRVSGGTLAVSLLKELGVAALYVAASLPAIALLALCVASH